MLRARAETDERNVRLFARCYQSNLADLDLGGDHLVSEVGDKGCDACQAVLALVRDKYAKALHVERLAVAAMAKQGYETVKKKKARERGPSSNDRNAVQAS
jgi:hypothetical protein